MAKQVLSYGEFRLRVLSAAPVLADRLPYEKPAAPAPVDRRATIQAVRRAGSMLNEGTMVVGWGDGTAAKLIAEDGPLFRKATSYLVLPGEAPAFAHALDQPWFQHLILAPHHQVHFADTLDGARAIISRIFATHNDITRLAGTAVLCEHPLAAAPQRARDEWLPGIRKAIVERLDCLGNDVHDTFLGAKHAIMHGRRMVEYPRSSSLLNLHKGQSAICIASGPSARPHFERIREIQHEHVVICADSILGGLLDHGIEPDYVCMVERPPEMVKLIEKVAARCKTRLVALPVVHPSTIEHFAGRTVWWWNADDLYPWLDPAEPRLSSGRSAGTHTVAMAGVLGVADAWLVGHDLAYHEGRSHSEGTADLAVSTQAADTAQLTDNNPNYHLRRFMTAKNGGGTVETSGIWEIFRSDVEAIIAAWRGTTRFHNVNIASGVGALIAGCQDLGLPAASGRTIEKPRPERIVDQAAVEAHMRRSAALAEDFASIAERCKALGDELATLRPLQLDRAACERMASRLNICDMACSENRILIAYIFRAALRNLMVKLHHNTYVRTMPERNWNQLQVMRYYAATLPPLVARLRPELDEAIAAGAAHV
jgi:hypothetical protein